MKLNILVAAILFSSCNDTGAKVEKKQAAVLNDTSKNEDSSIKKDLPAGEISSDTADFNKRMIALSNDSTGKWPAKAPYPLKGAIFPYYRVVAFYGNLYSKRMGILGELPKDSMIKKLKGEINRWEKADATPVMPALHYIAVTAQANGGKQRLRMPFKQIDTILKWANEINALVFLDIQVGSSTLQEEIPELESYLKLANVHLGIDPEFSMKNGEKPGSRIGTFDAADINYAGTYLAGLVKKYNIPPKILVVHRFTQGMITNASGVKTSPEVQIVIDMDGWGSKILKRSTWQRYIYKEPIQFTGFKLFYKNDVRVKGWQMFTPEELLKFTPKPIYIQYQ